MARKPTLTQARLDELRAAYEAWNPFDPDSMSADELARSHGISKNTMYTWRQRGWRLDGRERSGQTGWKARDDRASPVDQADLEGVVRYLTEQLVQARIEIEALNAERAPTSTP